VRRDRAVGRATRPLRLRPLRSLLSMVLNPIVRPVLRVHMSDTAVRDLLHRTWRLYLHRLAKVDAPSQLTVGPASVLRLAAVTAALYDALLEQGETHEQSIGIVAEDGWAVYRRMGRIPWLLSRLRSSDPAKRLASATLMFRRFPFGPPAYAWVSKPAPGGVVAFDCIRCPVADYFLKARLGDVCVSTFCALDFPLAEAWGAKLHRTSSIAAGAPACDFQWHPDRYPPDVL